MIDPVDVQQIAVAAMLAGGIVFFGAAYAIFYALAMLGHSSRFLGIAYGGYLGLLIATVVLAVVLQLTGWWLILVVALLAGYFVGPRCIWRLSVALHDAETSDHARTADESGKSHLAEQQPL